MHPLELTLKRFISKQEDPGAILNRAFIHVTSEDDSEQHQQQQQDEQEEAEIIARYQQQQQQAQPPPYQLPAQQAQALFHHRQQVSEEEERIRTLHFEQEILRLTTLLERERGQNQELKSELAKKSRELANQTLQVETLTLHLNNFRENDSQTFLHSKKDRVMETESLKTRLSRAERDRDSLQFQIQEMERRHALQQDEESQIHAEFTSRVLENERRVSHAELARQRAEAEAAACRQQLEHWKSAARFAQEEVASLRASTAAAALSNGAHEYKRSMELLPPSLPPPQQQLNFSEEESSRAAASNLLRRQQQLLMQQQQPPAQQSQNRQRLQEIASEIRTLEENMENIGSEATRTLAQRLAREKMRRQIEELNREAAQLQQ